MQTWHRGGNPVPRVGQAPAAGARPVRLALEQAPYLGMGLGLFRSQFMQALRGDSG